MISSTMEPFVVTTNEQTGDCVHERLLLHWVNSLPLTKCLLVEELQDLRFGDVLLEIVAWLKCISADTLYVTEAAEYDGFDNDEVLKRLRRVVQFAASECLSQDEDAMYIVNTTHCATRVMAGQNDAICAVLNVLKRLSVKRLQEQESTDCKAALRRRQVLQEMTKQYLHSKDNVLHDKMTLSIEKSERTEKQVHPSSLRRQHMDTKMASKTIQEAEVVSSKTMRRKRAQSRRLKCTSPKMKTPRSQNTSSTKAISGICFDEKGLRVYGMLDPTATYQPPVEASDGCFPTDDEVAVRICNWIQLVLQIEISMNEIFAKRTEQWRLNPPRKVRQVFLSGVLLCRIAGAIIQRCRGQIHLNIAEAEEIKFVSENDPQTPEERRHNLTLALAVFKRFRVSTGALDSFACLQQPGKTVSPKTIWSALDEVFNRVERLAHKEIAHPDTSHAYRNHDNATVSTVVNETPSSPKHPIPPQLQREKLETTETKSSQFAPLKRSMPYITSEQIQVVNEWLTRVGLDMTKSVSRGVLHDPMRNGVLFCSLLTQVVKKTPFSYCKAPRTLNDIRANILAAFKRLGDFPQEQTLRCYLTTSAEKAVLLGNRQICYGILWHLWQISHSKFGFEEPSDGCKISPKVHKTSAGVDADVAIDPSPPMKLSPLVLDIPAVSLAVQENFTLTGDLKTSFCVTSHDTFPRFVAWEHDPSGDQSDNDVFPVPRVPCSSPVYSAGADSFSWIGNEKEENFSDTDDILPVHSQYDSKESRDFGQKVDTRAPSIEIEELSVAAPFTALPGLSGLPTHVKNNSASMMLSPIKKLPVDSHEEQNSKQSQICVEKIVAWLKRLGIHLKETSTYHDPSAKLTEFQSGVLLCCIVEKVEFIRGIPGITRPSSKNPLSKASALHNISKALAILQQKKTMPLHLSRRANAIYAGTRSVILQLLEQIYKAYGHHLVPQRPMQQN